MNFLELAKARHSVRSYTDKPVEAEKLHYLLRAAQAAPTAANLQPVRLMVVQGTDLEKLGLAANLFHAPLAIVVCADHSVAWKRPFDGKQTTDIDASIVTDHMMLAATEQGLGSVWICYFKPDVVRQQFALPEAMEPVNILAIGYSNAPPADPNRHERERVPLDTLILPCAARPYCESCMPEGQHPFTPLFFNK